MIINFCYEAFIRSLQLFYTGKLPMSDTIARATNQRIQYTEIYKCNWKYNQKAQTESFLILL